MNKSHATESPNRKYIDLLNNWAVKKKQENELVNKNVENDYKSKSTGELWMILKGAQETRVLAYRALDSFWKDFLNTKDLQTFQYYCELSIRAFNDINKDIRNMQKVDSLKESKQLIDTLQELEKKKFIKLLEFYRSIAPVIVQDALEFNKSSPNALSPSYDEANNNNNKLNNSLSMTDRYGKKDEIKHALQEIEQNISETLQEIQINCM
jgi:hypothetical protein